MLEEANYKEINKQGWNNRVEAHMKSDFYDLKGFLDGNSSLNEIELRLLGDLRGKSVLHLQCHFGQDSISLGRLGAKVMGVDLSDKAIEQAKLLAAQTSVDASFICCDLYDLPSYLDEQFDRVFTSYGTIGWLPDLDRWANLISRFLKPDGKLVFVEFHPVVWMFDDDFRTLKYSYFNTGAIIESETGTYADKEATGSHQFVSWNHGVGEVLNSLLKCGLEINSFEEFDYSPYNCFEGTIEIEPKKFRIKHLGNKIPMIYALTATLKV